MYNIQVTRKVRAGSTVGIGPRLPDEKKNNILQDRISETQLDS